MNKELRRMATIVKAAYWLNLIAGGGILFIGVRYREWPTIVQGVFFIAFAAIACPYMLKEINRP